MTVGIFLTSGAFGLSRDLTATERSRFRHTKKMLIKSERALLEKMARAKENPDSVFAEDIRQHGLEIFWGWGQLKKIVEMNDFDKIPEKKKGSGKFTRAASPGLWKKNFNEKEIELVNSIMRDSLSIYEYEI